MKPRAFEILLLLSSFLGIGLMYVGNRLATPAFVKIGEIKEDMNYIKVLGDVVSKANTSKATFLKVSDDTGSIKVVFFKEIEVKERDKVEIVGKIQTYKGELEIIGETIKKI